MEDILEAINNLVERLWSKYGNPLKNYKKTQDDVCDTFYVGHLMNELGHNYVMPEKIRGDHEDRVYYSERALHDAFLAGRLLSRVEGLKLRASIRAEVKRELINQIEDMDF